MSDDRPMNRRRFFREGLRELLRPLASAVEPLEEAARHLGQLEKLASKQARKVPLDIWLRPPGALEETLFRETCSRCGVCVSVCPAHCIKIDPTGARGNGAPYIEPNVMACVVCESLACMNHCPSGALVPTPLSLIDMGTAQWLPQHCLRSEGEDCTVCIDQCPIGEVAIALVDGKIEVREEGCIGCGVCQHDCPTDPKAILVRPKAARA
jgi:ferredoxin-type protein NapG